MQSDSLSEHISYPVPGCAMSWLTIDLDALAGNYDLLQEYVGDECSVAGIVKADAYGIGMKQVVPVLEKHGCTEFFVATFDEALALRKITGLPVFMLGGLLHGIEAEYVQNNIIPVLNSNDDVVRWHKYIADTDSAAEAALQFDTGMNRLGISMDGEVDQDGINVSMVMSHFACANEADNQMTNDQYDRFKIVAAQYPQARKSLANSSGIFRSKNFHFDMVRPGMALYGLNPVSEKDNPMRLVVRLQTRILQVKMVKKHGVTGYGATYRFERDSVIATVALGYADGFFRSNGNKAVLYYRGVSCPVIGRISMDLVTVDMGDARPEQGDVLEVLGPNQSADDFAAAAGTIGYEVLTSLGKRYHRDYIYKS